MKSYSIKELNKIHKAFILAAINADGYDEDPKTEKEQLQFVFDCFKSDAIYPYNLNRFNGNMVNMFADHLQGLPSWFNIPFSNYDILQLLKKWGTVDEKTTEKREDKLLANYWNWVANKFFLLARRANVDMRI